jgi:hypothetical protein
VGSEKLQGDISLHFSELPLHEGLRQVLDSVNHLLIDDKSSHGAAKPLRALVLGMRNKQSPSIKEMQAAAKSSDAQAVPKMTSLADPDHDRKWAGGKYRYVIDIGRRAAGRGGILVRTETRPGSKRNLMVRQPAAKHVLKSNNTLEKNFLQILSSTLARADAELTED